LLGPSSLSYRHVCQTLSQNYSQIRFTSFQVLARGVVGRGLVVCDSVGIEKFLGRIKKTEFLVISSNSAISSNFGVGGRFVYWENGAG